MPTTPTPKNVKIFQHHRMKNRVFRRSNPSCKSIRWMVRLYEPTGQKSNNCDKPLMRTKLIVINILYLSRSNDPSGLCPYSTTEPILTGQWHQAGLEEPHRRLFSRLESLRYHQQTDGLAVLASASIRARSHTVRHLHRMEVVQVSRYLCKSFTYR